MQQICMPLILWHTGEEQWIMQARGNLFDFQIREKRKETGEEGLEKSWATGEVRGLSCQCKHRSCIAKGSEHEGRNTLAHTISLARYFAFKVEKGSDV